MAEKIVSFEQWQAARAELLKEEKAAMRQMDDLASRRRQLPMVEIPNAAQVVFKSLDNEAVRLPDLFDGRKQLIVYHHMPFNMDGEACKGCSFFSDHIPNAAVLQHLHIRDTTFAATAPEDPAALKDFHARMDWQFPFYSSKDTWSDDIFWQPSPGAFRLNYFLRKDDKIYLTWSTTSRGVEPILTTYSLLDMTKLGRQDEGNQFKLHDQY